MRSDSLARLLECFKVARTDMLWVVASVHDSLKLLAIHIKLNVTAHTCHTLVIGLVTLHLQSLVLISTAS